MSTHRPTCQDCYFRRQGLCALALERPCPTFRAAGGRLEPPRHPTLVARPSQGLVAHGPAYAAA
jgi:hypothetical protein